VCRKRSCERRDETKAGTPFSARKKACAAVCFVSPFAAQRFTGRFRTAQKKGLLERFRERRAETNKGGSPFFPARKKKALAFVCFLSRLFSKSFQKAFFWTVQSRPEKPIPERF
jgi:hypothetical protein